ncbi:hypothetical protein KY49_711 [Burkholderia sp. MSHR3999]|uniref:hypothetical protein n=1 Tax=Burkholderia sp. MSHR3999 TaxID=1542965 RepID=UPI0005B72DF3|nr:hypothetical protein [Burkholderia sp. MSHR3999]KIP13038.1 hypothetical protein KY49_711 [Burkholderia sp. MSHR3999]
MSDPHSTSPCGPVSPTLPTCDQMMASAIAAYTQLLSGAREVVKVKSIDNETEFSRRNPDALLKFILNLHQQCPCAQSYAVLGIPCHRAPGRVNFVDHGWEGAYPLRRRW